MKGKATSQEERLELLASARERRQHRRKKVLWAAVLETAAGRFECIALDLSLGGVKLRLAERIGENVPVTLVITRIGALKGVIAWQADGAAGIRFTEDPQQIAAIIGTNLPLSARGAEAG